MSKARWTTRHPRRAVALVLTVLVITALLATAAQLATLSSTRAVVNDRRSHTLQHRLAVNSAIEVIARAVADDDGIGRALDRDQRIEAALKLGDCEVDVSIQDDGAKFNVLPFTDERSLPLLRRKLQDLGRLMRLPEMEIEPRPVFMPKNLTAPIRSPDTQRSAMAPYVTFDQLFAAPQSPLVFRWDFQDKDSRPEPVWSNYLSLFGDGRIDLRRADRQVVALVLRDVQGGWSLAGRGTNALEDTLANVDEAVRPRVAARLGYGLDRYALTIQTAVGSDVRCWYVVATLRQGQAALLYKQQITW